MAEGPSCHNFFEFVVSSHGHVLFLVRRTREILIQTQVLQGFGDGGGPVGEVGIR